MPGQRGEDGARLVPGPELAAVVDVEGNVQAFAGSPRGRILHGPPRLLAEGGGDPREVQDAGAVPEGGVDVVPAEGGSGGTGAVVEGAGDVGGALLQEHHAGAAAGVLTVVHRDALAPQLPQDELAVRVGADHSGPAHPVAEPRDARRPRSIPPRPHACPGSRRRTAVRRSAARPSTRRRSGAQESPGREAQNRESRQALRGDPAVEVGGERHEGAGPLAHRAPGPRRSRRPRTAVRPGRRRRHRRSSSPPPRRAPRRRRR